MLRYSHGIIIDHLLHAHVPDQVRQIPAGKSRITESYFWISEQANQMNLYENNTRTYLLSLIKLLQCEGFGELKNSFHIQK